MYECGFLFIGFIAGFAVGMVLAAGIEWYEGKDEDDKRE